MNLHVVLLYCIQTRDENSVSRKRGFNKKPVSTFRGCHLISNKWWCPKSEIFERICVHFYGYILDSKGETDDNLLTDRQTDRQTVRQTDRQTDSCGDYMLESLSNERVCSGVMGVPITFIDKYNPDQFEIVGLDRYVPDNPRFGHRFTINGRETYARVLIKHRRKM